MNFFERQDDARGKTKVLVLYFALAVVCTIIAVNAAVYSILALSVKQYVPLRAWLFGPYCWYVAIGTALVIAIGSAVRTLSLSGGGVSVAQMVNARRVEPSTGEPSERRFVNVVEELSIASGVPVPQIFVMEHEQGINAFVAGFTPAETVMVVTKGALDTLDRDELQGVVGHEYSHIFNGDMRINLRLIGILAGILVIGQIGQFMLRASSRRRYYSSRSSSKGDPTAAIVVLGLALFVIGYIGLFFGRLIQAAISRQREYLADASSVQYTRNPAGIAGALLKIKEATEGSLLADSHAQEMSHMCFEMSVKAGFSGLLATHPPIEERIKAIDPSVLEDVRRKKAAPAGTYTQSAPAAGASGFAGGGGGGRTVIAAGLSGSVGNPTPEHFDYAQALYASIPVGLLDALHNPRGAAAAVYTLVVAGDNADAKRALSLLQGREGGDLTSLVMDYRRALSELGPGARLPFVDLAVPALRRLGPDERERFFATLEELVELDNEVTIFEYALLSLVRKYLSGDGRAVSVKHRAMSEVASEAGLLMAAMGYAGGDEDGARKAMLGLGLEPSDMPSFGSGSARGLGAAVKELSAMPSTLKQKIIDACTGCVSHDGRITLEEAELLRAVSASLDCPMPPVLA